MTKDEIIEMAKEAGYRDLPTVRLAFQGFDKVAFAKLVAAKEREACAKYLDSQNTAITDMLAAEIRARG